MEGVLSFLERLVLVVIGVFAIYQCFQIGDRSVLGRPAASWTARLCLIALAAVCFFTVANLVGNR